MTLDARRQGRHQSLAVRGPPACPQEVGDERADRQILNQKARIAFETRVGRSMGSELALVMDRRLHPRGAAPLALAGAASLAFSMPLGLVSGLTLALMSGRPSAARSGRATPDRSAKFRALVQRLQHQAFQIGRRKRVDVRRRRHSSIDSDNRRFGNTPPGNFYSPHPKPNPNPRSPGLLPLIPKSMLNA